jgi:hypothetical protein
MAVVVALASAVGLALVLVPLVDGVPLIGFTADDAYISFRYSNHFADGLGPVWNAVGPRTDGYTSPLWMALVALGDLLGAGPEATSKTLSLLAALGILAMLGFGGGGRALLVRGVAIGLLVVSPAFMAITVQGFETTTAGFLATAEVLLLVEAVRRPERRTLIALALVGTLASFARPDLLPFVLACFAGLGICLLRAGDRPGLRRAAIWVVVAFVLPGVLWAVWHRIYYGYPLPNTSYVKQSSGFINDASLELIKTFVTRVAAPALIALAVLGVRAWRRRSSDPGFTWAIGSVLVGSAAFLAVGLKFEPIQGDIWRFQMPIYPVLLLCVVLLASRDPWTADLGNLRGARLAAALAVGAVVVASALNTLGTVRYEIRGRWVDDRHEAGKALAPFKDDGLRMFVSESGVLPWAADWQAYDLIGLNDHTIAQKGATVERVTALRPDLLQFIVATGEGAQFRGFYKPFADLIASGRYRFATATVKTNDDLKPGVPPQAHLYFVRAASPRAGEVVAALRGMRHVRLLSPEITKRALDGFEYPGPR